MGRRTTFPRVSGGIVLDSFSLASFFTGLLAILPAGLLALVGSLGGRSAAFAAFTAVVWYLTVLLVVSRFAQLGILGETDAGLFSDAAGPWAGTALVALRLLALWIAWLIPIVVWGWLAVPGEADGTPAAGMAGLRALLFGVPKVPAFPLVWAALGSVLSFAFVAVAAAAPRFVDAFSPGLWGPVLAGRPGELFLAMAGTWGPPAAVFVVSFPLVLAMLPANPKATAALLVPVLLYLLGMVMTLQGKLAGAFSAAGLTEGLEEEAPAASEVRAAPPASPREEAHPPSGPGAAAEPSAAAPAAGAAGSHLDPRTLEAAWKANLVAGDEAGALHVASELIPAALARGEVRLASQAYRRHLDRLPELGLDRNALDVVADQLLKDGDVAAAAWTFSKALEEDVADPKAFKGLLRVADHHLEKAKTPFEAVRVYRYLLDRAPASPFADHVRDLLATAERRASRPAGPG